MFFIEDVLKKIVYLCIIGIVLIVGYIAYDVFLSQKVYIFLSEFINNNTYLKYIYESIKDLTWIGWAKIGTIVSSPIVVVFVVIQSYSGGFTFRKKRRSVDYGRRIKNRWR